MAHRAAPLVALLSLACTALVPGAASAAAPVSYTFTPGTVVLNTGWRTDEQGVGHFYSMLLKPDGCLLREFAFKDAQPQITDTPCHLMPGSSLTLGKTDVFAISVDFPGHSQQIIFRTTPTSVSAGLGENPGVPNLLLSGYHEMVSAPPTVDVQGINRWSSAIAPQVVHLVTDGLDCKFEVVGQGSTPCVVSSWSDRNMTVLMSGAFLQQPDAVLNFDVGHPVGGAWGMRPMGYAPNSPLMLAVLRHDLKAVDELLTQGGKPGDSDLDASLRAAIGAGQVDIAEALVDQGAPLNGATRYQVPVLNLAAGMLVRDAATGNYVHDPAKVLDLIKDMVAHGASVTQGGSASLFSAIGAHDPALVEFLLDHGADANAQDSRGSIKRSAYEEASGNVAVLDVLLRHGAKPQAAPRPAETASEGQQFTFGPNGAVAVVAPAGPAPSATAVQGNVLLYGGDYEKDSPLSAHALLIDGGKCRYQITRLDPGGASRTEYSCQLLPSDPIVPRQSGTFTLVLRLPEGPVTLRGTSGDGLWFDMQSASQKPPSIKLASRLGLMQAALPVMQLDTDIQPGTHVSIDGFDCTMTVAGQGSNRCLLSGWGPLGPNGASKTSVVMSGVFLRQPDRDVHLDFTQSGSTWIVSPAHLYPYSPVLIAAYWGDLKGMDALIAKGADLSSHDPHLDAPLATALARDHADVAAELIAHGAKLDELTLAGHTVLSTVISHAWHDPTQPLALVTQLLDQGAGPDQSDRDGMTPLLTAIEGGHKDVVQWLVAKGADVNGRPGRFGPPLVAAISRGDLDSARLLVAHGADVNAARYDGDTPLLVALGSHDPDPAAQRDFIRLLLDHGADVNRADKQGFTPLMAAAVSQTPGVTPMLLAKGANPLAKADLDGHAVDAATLGGMFKQRVAEVQDAQKLDRPLANQGMPMGTLLSFTAGAFGGVTLVGQPGAAGSDETVTVTNVMGGKAVSAMARKDGGFALVLPGKMHDLFRVQISNTNLIAEAKSQGLRPELIPRERHGPAVYMHGDDPVLTLTARMINTGPIEDTANVVGTYTGPSNLGIEVGGYTAQLSDGKFVANDVNLALGEDTIHIKLTTQGGLVLEQDLKVFVTAHTDMVMGMNPYKGGFAPLKVDFFCSSALPGEEFKSLRFSYRGDEDDVTITDAAGLNAAAGRAMVHPLQYTYDKPGIYTVRATAVDAAGATKSAQMLILVQDPVKLDAVLKALWADYLMALRSGDEAALVQFVQAGAQQALDQEKDHAVGYSPLYGGPLSGGGPIYTMQRDGQTVVVSFSQDFNGVWRIHFM